MIAPRAEDVRAAKPGHEVGVVGARLEHAAVEVERARSADLVWNTRVVRSVPPSRFTVPIPPGGLASVGALWPIERPPLK